MRIVGTLMRGKLCLSCSEWWQETVTQFGGVLPPSWQPNSKTWGQLQLLLSRPTPATIISSCNTCVMWYSLQTTCPALLQSNKQIMLIFLSSNSLELWVNLKSVWYFTHVSIFHKGGDALWGLAQCLVTVELTLLLSFFLMVSGVKNNKKPNVWNIWLTDIIFWSSLSYLTTEVIHIKILLTWRMHARKSSSPLLLGNISSGHWLNCGFWLRAKAFLYPPSARGHSFKRALPYHIKVEILLHPVGGAVKLFNHFHDVECVQGVHYGGPLYAPCKRQKLRD